MTDRMRNLVARLKSAQKSYLMCRRSMVAPPAWAEDFRREVLRLETLIRQTQTADRD